MIIEYVLVLVDGASMATATNLRVTLLSVGAAAALVAPVVFATGASAQAAVETDAPAPVEDTMVVARDGRNIGSIETDPSATTAADATAAPTPAPTNSFPIETTGAAQPEPTAPADPDPSASPVVPDEPGATDQVTTEPAPSQPATDTAPGTDDEGGETEPTDDTDGYIIWNPDRTFASDGSNGGSRDEQHSDSVPSESEGAESDTSPSQTPKPELSATGAEGASAGLIAALTLTLSGGMLLLARRIRGVKA